MVRSASGGQSGPPHLASATEPSLTTCGNDWRSDCSAGANRARPECSPKSTGTASGNGQFTRALTALGTSPLRFFLLHPHGSPLYPPSAPMIDSCAPRKRSHWYSRWPPCGWVRFWCCFPGFLKGGRGARSGKQNGRLTIGRTRYHERGGWRTTGAFPAAAGRESRRTAPALCWLSASVLNPE